MAGLVVIVCALPYFLGAQQSSLVSLEESGIAAPEGDLAKQLVLAAVYAGVTYLLARRTSVAQALRALGTPLCILLALCFVSALWAELPGVAFRRSVALAGTCVVGLYAGTHLDERELAQALIRSIFIVLVLSFMVALAFPASGLDPEGRLRGVTAHKNGLGSLAALGLLAVAATWNDHPVRGPGRRLAQLGFIACCLAALVLSDSATPIPALAFGLLVLFLARWPWTRSTLPALLILTVFVIGVLTPLLAAQLGGIATLLGRDADFSGRILVWLFSLELIQTRPLLGFGYGAFWNGESALAFFHWSRFPVVNAHNGFLQLTLDTGLAGLLLLASALLAFVSRAREAIVAEPGSGAAFAFACVAFLLAGNITEARLMVGNDPFTMLFVFVLVRCNDAAAKPKHMAIRRKPAPGLAARSIR